MKLSKLYRERFESIQALMERREKAQRSQDYSYFTEQSLDALKEAGDIAHCIALFGDMSCDEFLQLYEDAVRELQGGYGHPWRNGAYQVRKHMGSISQANFG